MRRDLSCAVLLVLQTGACSVAIAQDSQTLTFNLSAANAGPISIRAYVTAPVQAIPLAAAPPSGCCCSPPATPNPPPASASSNPVVPTPDAPQRTNVSQAPVGLWTPTDEPLGYPYVCYNYVYDQIAGSSLGREGGANDITTMATGLGYQQTSVNPGDPLPSTFPPGTVILFNNHVGIIGQDGSTLFNYTRQAPRANPPRPAAINQSPSVQQVWSTPRQAGPDAPVVYPYANSPVTVLTPPQH